MEPVPSTVAKTYPRRGPLQQFRFAENTAFTCFRCGNTKKSKLITVYYGDWSKRLCNGCYGRLLSLFDVKAGTAPDDQRADELAAALLSMVAEGEELARQAIMFTIGCDCGETYHAGENHVDGPLNAVTVIRSLPLVSCRPLSIPSPPIYPGRNPQ
jgi:hypothetical protein